jgi:hypothetical protein
MTTQHIRDRQGNIIGTLSIFSDRQELRNRTGTYMGYYDNNNDITRDRNGGIVGTGNLLMTLLTE